MTKLSSQFRIVQEMCADEPVLSHDDTADAMVKILDGLRTIAVQHVRAAENIKEQLTQQGQDMSREEIMTTIILPHFKNAFAGMQAKVLEVVNALLCDNWQFAVLTFPCINYSQEFDVDEEELEECVRHYVEHSAIQGSKLQEAVSKIKAICAQFTGDVDSGKASPSGGTRPAATQELSLDQLFDVLETFAAKTKDYFGRFAEEYVQSYGVPSTQAEIARFADQLTEVSDRYCCYFHYYREYRVPTPCMLTELKMKP